MKKTVGLNLLIDVYNLEKKFLERRFLLKLLKDLLKIIKAKPVGKPIVKKISSPKYPYTGYSILQIIQESHLSLHTWPENNYLAIDIFSCQKFSQKEILIYLKKVFNKEAKIKIKSYKRICETMR